MTIERAAEILGGAKGHGEEFYKEVEEACRFGRDALLKLVKKSPFPDGDKSIYACAYCGSGEYLFNEDGGHNRCCGNCGQAIDWSADFDDGGDRIEDYLRDDAVPTNCRQLLTECKQLTESEVDDGKEHSAGYEKPAGEKWHDERASGPGRGNPGADGVF